jgi:hypothetical protein
MVQRHRHAAGLERAAHELARAVADHGDDLGGVSICAP